MIRSVRPAAIAFIAALAAAGPVLCADYPVRPVKWVVPYPPAGTTDVLARIVAQWLSEKMGQPFVVENKPGAGNNIGVEYVVNLPPDGYTMLLVNPANGINRALADPRMRERLAELGGKSIAGTPEDFGKVIAAETAKWEKVVNASGAKAE